MKTNKLSKIIHTSKYQMYLKEKWCESITYSRFYVLLKKLWTYEKTILYLRDKKLFTYKYPNDNVKENSIKYKYKEYLNMTQYSPCTYHTFWKYYVINKISFNDICETKFTKWWPNRLWLWDISNHFRKAKSLWYKFSYSTFNKQIKNNTLDMKYI